MKVQLKQSPLKLLSHEFLEIHLNANLKDDAGGGAIAVDRDIQTYENLKRQWRVILQVTLQASDGDLPPTYTGGVTIAGMFEVAEGYKFDPERLIRVTAASILYGAVRELIANLTARSANGMMSIPSVSFMEQDQPKKAAKKQPKKAPKKVLKNGKEKNT